MKLFVLIATVVACTCAAPTVELQHPSPVNPSVLVELKPEEKIILITDPKEIAKFKRETKQPLYPTVLPREHVHHITKRDHKPDHESKSKPKPKPKAPEAPKAPTETKKPQPSHAKRNRRNVEAHQKPENNKAEEFQKPQVLPAILPPEDVNRETTESKNNREEETTKANNDNNETHQDIEEGKNVTTEVYQKPQGLPAIFSPSNKATQQQKRDIPVPLVPKHHHPEESPKESMEKENQEEKQNHEHQKPQGFPAIFSPSNDAIQKRDIPVPLVPKYHHPEESPKEVDEKEAKTEVNTVPQNHDHVAATFEFQNPQTLPLKETTEDSQQHKRDIPVPLVPKHHHLEESPKQGNEKESHDDKKVDNFENHHVPLTLVAHIQDHVAAEDFQKPQTHILKDTPDDIQQHKRDTPEPLVPNHQHHEEIVKLCTEKDLLTNKKEHEIQTLSSHSEEHITAEGFQKPQTIPLIVKETTEDSQQHKRDIPVPLVPKYHHPEESPKETNEKEDHGDKKVVNAVPQTLPTQKPQTLPFILKESAEDSQQHKRDITVPLVPKYHHPEESPKDSNEKELHNVSKEINTENQQLPQTLQVPTNEHNFEDGLQKPQSIRNIVKETNEDTQQQKRDISLAKQESPKDNSDEKKLDEEMKVDKSDNHQVPQNHHVTQTLPTLHEHLNTEGIHNPQVVSTINHEHTTQPSFQKPQVYLNYHDHLTQKINENREDVAQTYHISQTLPGHIHKHLAVEGIQKSQDLPEHNQGHILPTHQYEHFHPEGWHKPQTIPTVLKESTDATPHQESDIVSPVKSQHEEIPKRNENAADNHPNKHEVQVEDLSESKPFQQPIHHALPTQGNHKPNILDDHLSAYDFTTSTTTVHPVLRHRPVPVAELFARAHDN